MPNDRYRRRLIVAAAAALVLVFAATWVVLDLTEDRPAWLVVEGPETAVVGRPIEFRVRLVKSARPGERSIARSITPTPRGRAGDISPPRDRRSPRSPGKPTPSSSRYPSTRTWPMPSPSSI